MSQSDNLQQAVILAGGLGSRLGKLTSKTPKPLVEVNGKPFLEYQLRLLRSHGVVQVMLLTGYLGEQIESALGSGESLDIEITYCREEAPLGTGGALLLAKDKLPETFFLVYGDSYLDVDYQQIFKIFLESRSPGPAGLMVVYPQGGGNEDPGNVKLDPSQTRVVSYSKGHGGDHNFVDAGVSIFTSDVALWIPRGRQAALEEHVYPELARQGRLLAYNSPERFYDIGTAERLAVFERSIS